MDSEDLSFGVFIVLLIGVMGLCYWSGKWFEDRRWKALIPAQMDMLCKECAGIEEVNNANGYGR